ncbi:MAG: hypothetical protein A3H97_25010 [Acidobacteria bacterium RIFCSPLOWO2_02_FULL_65_29]|nr:MAG: hypothetical protein A3H97_25010 [Acidobacteria bacterium RIFCSPLOWO2_02_FULL_65_29]
MLLAERSAAPSDVRGFRRERDRIYEIADAEVREASFRTLHLGCFARLRLDGVIEQVMREHPDIVGRLQACRVVRALTRQEEGADLVDAIAPGDGRGQPILVLRLRSTTIVEPDTLRALLRHELMHVADMLDPTFGYERTLPSSNDGPSSETILRDRYRVLWDTTIDGRLVRAGLSGGSTRDARWREFAAAFAMLGERGPTAFERWFAEPRPGHAEIVRFATAPLGVAGGRDTSRCPLCRFPVATLDSRAERAPEPLLTAIREQHPTWHAEDGLCPQCFDLYEARYGHECSNVAG